MEKEEIRICCVDSLYTLFLYFLICGVDENDLFIVSKRVPEHIRKKINHILFNDLDYSNYNKLSKINKLKRRVINILKRIYGVIRLRCLLYLKTRKYKVVKAYAPGHLNYSFPIYEYENSFLLEDGLSHYVLDIEEPKFENTLRTRILHFFGIYITDDSNACLGTHKNIKKVYLTQDNVPPLIKNKTEVINIKELWNMKTELEKNKILEIYDIKDTINNLDNNLILLLTQCISEDNLLELDEEINIYRYLIEKQGNNNIILKTHPRERKDYSIYFPNITIINKPFPLEILKCIEVKIDKIITVTSNSALHFADECEIELYDQKTSSEILNKQIELLKGMIKEKK